MKKNKGITLIALVVTIIILLILAAVSINLVLGQMGILGKASTSKEEYKKSEVKERIELVIIDMQAETNLKGTKLTNEIIVEQLPNKLEKIEEISQYANGVLVKLEGYNFYINEKDMKITYLDNLEMQINVSLESNNQVVENSQKYDKITIKIEVIAKGGTTIVLPNNTEIQGRTATYDVTENGSFKFIARSDQEEKEQMVEISQIKEYRWEKWNTKDNGYIIEDYTTTIGNMSGKHDTYKTIKFLDDKTFVLQDYIGKVYGNVKYKNNYFIAGASLYQWASNPGQDQFFRAVYRKIIPTKIAPVQGDSKIEDVRSSDITAYPKDGIKDGFWYKYIGSNME